jgi:hypothetical protein
VDMKGGECYVVEEAKIEVDPVWWRGGVLMCEKIWVKRRIGGQSRWRKRWRSGSGGWTVKAVKAMLWSRPMVKQSGTMEGDFWCASRCWGKAANGGDDGGI